MKWPCFERQLVGNCAFCWAAEWSDKHERFCEGRKERYLKAQEEKERQPR
jgi:hypothetical protein